MPKGINHGGPIEETVHSDGREPTAAQVERGVVDDEEDPFRIIGHNGDAATVPDDEDNEAITFVGAGVSHEMTDDTEDASDRDECEDEQFTEMQGGPLGDWIEQQGDIPSARLSQEETDAIRNLAIAQAHAQFLATVVRGLLERLYGGKVAHGELPAADLMPMIAGELDTINRKLNALTENGGA